MLFIETLPIIFVYTSTIKLFLSVIYIYILFNRIIIFDETLKIKDLSIIVIFITVIVYVELL